MVPADTFMNGVRDHTDRIDGKGLQLESQAHQTGLEVLVIKSIAEQHLVEPANSLECRTVHQELTEPSIRPAAETADPGIHTGQQRRIELIRPAVRIQLQ